MAESKKSFVKQPLGHGPDESKRAASWTLVIKAESEGKELDLSDPETVIEEDLKIANQEAREAKAIYERRKHIDSIKNLPPNPMGTPAPPRDPKFVRDDATLGDAKSLERDWKDKKGEAEKLKNEKTKIYAAVASVVETIMNTVDRKHGERVANAMATLGLKGQKMKQLQAAIDVVTKNLDTDPYDMMQKMRDGVTELRKESPATAQDVLDIIHQIESKMADAEAYSQTFNVQNLLTSADAVATIKGLVSELSSVELGNGAEEVIRKANHNTDWIELVAEASRELNSKNSVKKHPEKKNGGVVERAGDGGRTQSVQGDLRKGIKETQR